MDSGEMGKAIVHPWDRAFLDQVTKDRPDVKLAVLILCDDQDGFDSNIGAETVELAEEIIKKWKK